MGAQVLRARVHSLVTHHPTSAGNSLSALLDGKATLTFLNRAEDYTLTMPYAHCKGERLHAHPTPTPGGQSPGGCRQQKALVLACLLTVYSVLFCDFLAWKGSPPAGCLTICFQPEPQASCRRPQARSAS